MTEYKPPDDLSAVKGARGQASGAWWVGLVLRLVIEVDRVSV